MAEAKAEAEAEAGIVQQGPVYEVGHEFDANHALESVVDDAIDTSDGGEVSLHSILEAWGDRSYGPLFAILGFFAGTPLAIVPGVAGVIGVIMALIAIQMAFGRKHPWLPQWALQRSISRQKLVAVRDKTHGLLTFFDKLVRERWTWATGALMRRLAALAVFVLALLMIPLEFVPFAGAAPAFTIALLGVAIMARDGILLLTSAAATVGVIILALMVL